jgi:hypothetical protein
MLNIVQFLLQFKQVLHLQNVFIHYDQSAAVEFLSYFKNAF